MFCYGKNKDSRGRKISIRVFIIISLICIFLFFLGFKVLAAALNIDATPLYFGLLSGATLGGNCTPVGASANITGIGILKKSGYAVKNGDFFRIGIPFTVAAVVPAYIYIWIMYGI